MPFCKFSRILRNISQNYFGNIVKVHFGSLDLVLEPSVLYFHLTVYTKNFNCSFNRGLSKFLATILASGDPLPSLIIIVDSWQWIFWPKKVDWDINLNRSKQGMTLKEGENANQSNSIEGYQGCTIFFLFFGWFFWFCMFF